MQAPVGCLQQVLTVAPKASHTPGSLSQRSRATNTPYKGQHIPAKIVPQAGLPLVLPADHFSEAGAEVR
jgi:hypothetical protein